MKFEIGSFIITKVNDYGVENIPWIDGVITDQKIIVSLKQLDGEPSNKFLTSIIMFLDSFIGAIAPLCWEANTSLDWYDKTQVGEQKFSKVIVK